MNPPFGITTGIGDRGATRLVGGEETPKCSARMEAVGTLDELNSVMGLARSHCAKEAVRVELERAQRLLVDAAAETATPRDRTDRLARRIGKVEVGAMETALRDLQAVAPPVNGFVVPGACRAGAFLDQARAVARRAERRLVALARDNELDNAALLVWVNRLSDLLWWMARIEDEHPAYLNDTRA